MNLCENLLRNFLIESSNEIEKKIYFDSIFLLLLKLHKINSLRVNENYQSEIKTKEIVVVSILT